jgi:hypothetical protein
MMGIGIAMDAMGSVTGADTGMGTGTVIGTGTGTGVLQALKGNSRNGGNRNRNDGSAIGSSLLPPLNVQTKPKASTTVTTKLPAAGKENSKTEMVGGRDGAHASQNNHQELQYHYHYQQPQPRPQPSKVHAQREPAATAMKQVATATATPDYDTVLRMANMYLAGECM